MWLRKIILSASLAFTAVLAHSDNAMLGVWENKTNGDVTGVNLLDNENCEIFVERALKPRSTRKCKYEPFEDRHLIFLFNEHGSCNTEADFEMIYEPEAPLIHLLVGSADVVLHKVNN